MIKKICLSILLFSVLGFAQQPVRTVVDSTKIKIGSQLNLTLKIKGTSETRVAFPEVKNIGPFEVLESYPIDTVKKNNEFEFIKKYGLTQFDSGRYVIPRIPVLIGNKQFLTDSAVVQVNPVVVDTLKQKMYDIKPIIQVESDNSKWLWILLGLAVLGVLGYLGRRYYLRYLNREKEEEIVYASAIEKAQSLLKNLEKKELLERGDIKSYYSEMTDITRNYIEESVHIPAMESTTEELLEAMKKASLKRKLSLKQDTLATFERILKNADLVKFAKSKPMDFEIAEDRKNIESIILTIDKALPKVEEDEEAENFAKHQEELRLKKIKKRKQVILYSFISVLTALLTFYAFQEFNVFGDSAKSLYERDWITSEYGNPGMIVSTPKVLTRKDIQKEVPKEAMALLKEMQMFEYGGYFDDYYIMLSTSKFKNETKIDLDKSIEVGLQAMELKGAQDIIVKTQDFNTNEGLSGRKAYGTMNMINPITRKSVKVYYEYVVFSQEGGIQQILVAHQEGDEFGGKITARILESLELRKATQS